MGALRQFCGLVHMKAVVKCVERTPLFQLELGVSDGSLQGVSCFSSALPPSLKTCTQASGYQLESCVMLLLESMLNGVYQGEARGIQQISIRWTAPTFQAPPVQAQI